MISEIILLGFGLYFILMISSILIVLFVFATLLKVTSAMIERRWKK